MTRMPLLRLLCRYMIIVQNRAERIARDRVEQWLGDYPL